MAVTFLNDVSLGSDIELQLAGSSGGKLFANSKFYIQGDAIVFRSYDGGETYATFTDNSDVSLRHNNVIKFETESFGTSTKGYLQIDNDPDTSSDIKTAINVGTSDNTGSSAFAVSVANDAEEVYISSNLFYNGSGGQLKPLTSSGSADIYMYIGDSTSTTTGTIVLGGHYAISGGGPSSLVSHMTIKGNGNVGIGDTNPQVKLQLPDNAKIGLGNAGSTPDLQIYHDGSDSYVQDTGTGDLKLLGTNLRLKNGADTITFLEALSGGAVSIYHNGSKRFETTSGGIEITDEVSIGTSLVHTGDTDTKVSFGTDEIVLTTAGTDRVTVKPDGKVGIGISTGLAKELEVEGNIRTRQSGGTTAAEIDITSGATWRFRSNPTSGTNSYGLDIIKGSAGTDVKMSIDTNGNVGIGTAAPDTHLDVVGTDTSISVQDTANANGWAVFRTAASGSPLIGWNENRDFNFGVYNTNTPNTGWVGNRMTITGAGNVGIGTDAPAALLEIAGSGDALRIESTNSGAAGAQIDLLHFTASPADNDVNALINFGGYYTGTTSAYANQIKSVWSDVSDRDAELQFFTNNAGTLTKALTLDTGQNATFAGDIEVENSADGLILESPDGTRYRVTVANGGTLSVAAV